MLRNYLKRNDEKMMDLTNAIEEINGYKGSEKKKTLLYSGKKHLVKFPDL